jgi:hypothetical protein
VNTLPIVIDIAPISRTEIFINPANGFNFQNDGGRAAVLLKQEEFDPTFAQSRGWEIMENLREENVGDFFQHQ